MNHVKFRPWIGENYKAGFAGLRILILGESHYQWRRDLEIDDLQQLTIECIEEQIDDSKPVTFKFWTNVAMAFLGFKPTLQQKREFWHKVAFYNYVQQSAGFGPRLCPPPSSWKISEIPFIEVLNTLKPTFIVALGYRLRDRLPDLQRREGPSISDAPSKKTWIYPYVGGEALLYPIRHPSSAFSSSQWHKHISSAQQRAKELRHRGAMSNYQPTSRNSTAAL